MTSAARENGEEETVEAPPEARPKLAPVVILSIVIGALLTLLIGGSIYHWQSATAQESAQESELAAAKSELKHKTQQLADLQGQIAELSKQVHALKEFAVAKAKGVAAATISESAAAPQPQPQTNNQPGATKARPAEPDCQLVGKSPEDQVATIQRCMQSLDGQDKRR